MQPRRSDAVGAVGHKDADKDERAARVSHRGHGLMEEDGTRNECRDGIEIDIIG